MFAKVCPLCKNQFYGKNKYLEESAWHSKCGYNKKHKKSKKNQPIRTSTPISEVEGNSNPSFSDSVAEFFYQSWKSGLFSDESGKCNSNKNVQFGNQIQTPSQPVYATQVVYVNTVLYQPYFPFVNSYAQNVGYRTDGTFGFLPTYYSNGY